MSSARLASLLAALVLAACSDPAPEHRYRAEIRWTAYGIPHIEGDDLPSVLFGQGWAHARDAGCIVADQIVKVRSERSSFFGPGENDANLDSDFSHLTLGIYAKAEAGFPEQPQEIQDAITAYAAGFNAQLEESGDEWPCGGEPWVRSLDPIDLNLRPAARATRSPGGCRLRGFAFSGRHATACTWAMSRYSARSRDTRPPRRT